MKEMLKKAFNLDDIQEEHYVVGMFSGKGTRFILPKESVKQTASEFPFLKNAIRAGLILKNKK